LGRSAVAPAWRSMDTASHATILETCQTGDCTVWKAIIVLQLELGHPAKTLYRTQTGISGEPCGGQERSTCTCSILLPHLLPLSKPRLPRHSRPNAGPFPLDLQLICDFLHLPSSLSSSFLSLFLATLKLCVILVAPAALYPFNPQSLDFHHRQHIPNSRPLSHIRLARHGHSADCPHRWSPHPRQEQD